MYVNLRFLCVRLDVFFRLCIWLMGTSHNLKNNRNIEINIGVKIEFHDTHVKHSEKPEKYYIS